ncbi:hypothetical protein HHI36_010488 [Cryptolaemus montrouzieri]|uniref:Uncharacterized protein n=1 Tax=Cryptolaemus montrouzieri TaxID=559131 RepID=A0ABD2MJ16_9CUCU
MANKIFYFSNQRDMGDLMKLGFDDDDLMQTEDLDQENGIASEDKLEENVDDTATEQECIDDSDNEVCAVEEEVEGLFALGKNKKSKWIRRSPNKCRRRGAENIIVRLPGVIGTARQAIAPIECWNNFFH